MASVSPLCGVEQVVVFIPGSDVLCFQHAKAKDRTQAALH